MLSKNLKYSLQNYSLLLSNAQSSGYKFTGFDQISKIQNSGLCLLRHDVDADLQAAAKLAKVEFDLNIKSTYFLMLRSPCYNLMSRENSTLVKAILNLGHEIGLHYDQGFDSKRNFNKAQTEASIKLEAQWLETLFGVQVHAVSFHQPGPAVLQGEISTSGLVNTYDKQALAFYEYYSDSNRVFSLAENKEVTSALSSEYPKNIQLLIHPMWWVYENETTEAVWDQALLANFEMTQRQLIETERAYGTNRKLNLNQN